MKIHTLSRETTVPVDQQTAFSFFEDPRNLARITPAWLNFQIDTPFSGMRKGAVIDYRIRWMGLSLKWKTTITEYQPPHRFVDEQTCGPYALWRHEHLIEPVPGGARIADRVTYAMPVGALGELAHALVVRRQLEEIFNYRQKAVAAYFAGEVS